jgi:hypothetical protein
VSTRHRDRRPGDRPVVARPGAPDVPGPARPAGRPPTSRTGMSAPAIGRATCAAPQRSPAPPPPVMPASAGVPRTGRAGREYVARLQSPSTPTPSTCGTATYRAAPCRRRASPAKSAVSALATLMNSLPEMPLSTRKVTPPSSLTQTACTGLPAANRPTTAGTGGGGEGKVTDCLFWPLQAAHSGEH